MRSNKNLAWGAKASDYREEIARAVADGYIPVLIELVIDIDLPEGAIDINHHDARSTEPASILQALDLLGIEPTRHDLLVATNDSGFLHGLLRFGATTAEIAEVRAEERRVQAITAEQEEQAIAALRDMRIEEINGVALGIVDNLPHSRFAPVSDHAFAEGQVDCLVSVCRGEEGSHEIQFEWYPELVRALAEKYPDSWSGGQYWGSYADPDEVICFILGWLEEHGAPEGVAKPSPRRQ
ncbi:MAG: hypothetical protein HGA38_03285 [Candidatus Moranbacteria bacterium]|nr:hypothetical protein [Candidatus Moranbacteria bacterium]